jgi:hypothetical protein
MFSMQSTVVEDCGGPIFPEALESLEDELAVLTAHLNATTARWLELALEFRRRGGASWDDFVCWLAFRCGITVREAREYVRVAEALDELPSIRAAFQRGELTLTKVRALTRVAGPRTEVALLELAEALTAPQLERALRAYRRLSCEQARDTHELEYVDYYWAENGSLVLRARLAAEDGTVLVQALDAARERVWERRRAERTRPADTADAFEPPRSAEVEALVEFARSTVHRDAGGDLPEQARLVVHVDAAALATDDSGRCELEQGPVIAPETARRLGCDAEQLVVIERDGLPLSVGRRRRTVPPALRRLLAARDAGGCRWPGCDRRRHLAAHHRRHWARGGETSLDNLVLLCTQHHRLVHEGGYTIEPDPTDVRRLRFRNRHGVLHPTAPSRPPPGPPAAFTHHDERRRLQIDPRTNRHGCGERMDLNLTVAALQHVLDGCVEAVTQPA